MDTRTEPTRFAFALQPEFPISAVILACEALRIVNQNSGVEPVFLAVCQRGRSEGSGQQRHVVPNRLQIRRGSPGGCGSPVRRKPSHAAHLASSSGVLARGRAIWRDSGRRRHGRPMPWRRPVWQRPKMRPMSCSTGRQHPPFGENFPSALPQNCNQPVRWQGRLLRRAARRVWILCLT